MGCCPCLARRGYHRVDSLDGFADRWINDDYYIRSDDSNPNYTAQYFACKFTGNSD
jgi:hypothetical protein